MIKARMNKKGLVMELIALIVVAFITIFFFVGWSYGINLVNTALKNTPATSNETNISAAAGSTFSYYNDSLSNLKIIAIIIIFGYIIGTFITAYFTIQHPAMLFIYILTTILLIVMSVYISNAYEELLTNSVLGDTISGYSVGNYIMAHLPLWVGVIGIVGCILMLVGIIRGREYG